MTGTPITVPVEWGRLVIDMGISL
ncbi:hypothetical protein [Pectobacterium aroidearum]